MIRVARIPYLNSVPFYRGFPAPGVELLDLPPRHLGEAARAGEVDAGILSLCDTFDLEGFEPLVPMGIATRGPAHSVLLFSERHPTELDGATLGVTTETATSIRLLELLLAEVFEVQPARLERTDDAAPGLPAALLIGDRALRAAAEASVLPHRGRYGPGPVPLPDGGRWRWMLDLGDAWWRWRGQPFVFARWMVRSGIDEQARAGLVEVLESSLRDSLRDLGAVARAHTSAGLPAKAAEAYLRGFRYGFEQEEQQALRDFHELIVRAGSRPGRVATGS